jgi:O-antigen/teichoic acid export membrane protein
LLNYYTEVLLLLLRFKSNAKGYFKTFVIKTILDAGVTLFCVLVLRWGWYSRLAGFFCGYLFILFVMIRVISVRNLLAPFSRPEFKKFVIRATPFVLLQFFIIGLTNMDKIMIPQAFEKRDLALYGLAFQLGYLLPTVSSALTTMTQPVIYRLLSDYNEAARRKLQKIVFGSFGVILVAAIGIYLCMPLFYSHFINNPRYREGAYLVKYMLLAWTFWCCASILIDIIKKTGSRKQIVSSYFIPFLVLTGCLYFAGKYFGLVGITWSLILSYGLVFLLLIYYTRKQLSLLQAVNKNNHP